MCTVIVGVRLWPELPLVVAANRDEDLDRIAEPPAVRTHSGVRILAPRDAQAGGTWIGLNEHGVFVAITNRFGRPPNKAFRSRGMIVLDALAAPSAAAAYETARGLDPTKNNGFHLIVADRHAAYAVYNDTAVLTPILLAPGWHTVTERSRNAAPTDREPLIARTIADWPETPPDDARLRNVLSLEHPDGFNGVLVHVPSHRYGTRSSTIVRLPAAGAPTFLHADGRPDATPFTDYSSRVPHETH